MGLASSGNALIGVWAINPTAWGGDLPLGASVFQPLVFGGQYQDTESNALENNGSTVHRQGLVSDSLRTYDSSTGDYLQLDASDPQTLRGYQFQSSDPLAKHVSAVVSPSDEETRRWSLAVGPMALKCPVRHGTTARRVQLYCITILDWELFSRILQVANATPAKL